MLINGLVFNGIYCFICIHWILGVITLIVACAAYIMFRKEKKELDIKGMGVRDIFLKELRDYKFKLDRKNHKIV